MDIRTHSMVWPSALAPKGSGFDREPFQKWWSRVSHLLSHIHPQVAEQWVHRHWGHTPYDSIPLDGLACSLENWATNQLLEKVYIHGWNLQPACDRKAFLEVHRISSGGHPTVRPFQQHGTWDFPILVLHTPRGLRIDGTPVPETSHLLIEGHSRMRYLNALAVLGPPFGHAPLQCEHRIFVLGV